MKVVLGLLIVLLIALQYRLWFGAGSVQEVWRLHRELTEQRVEMSDLITRNQALEAEVSDLKSGLDAIEERARARLGMIDDDETFYQFVRDRGFSRGEASRAVEEGAGTTQGDETVPPARTPTETHAVKPAEKPAGVIVE